MSPEEVPTDRTAFTPRGALIDHVEGHLNKLKEMCEHRGLSEETYNFLRQGLLDELKTIKEKEEAATAEELAPIHFAFKHQLRQDVEDRTKVDNPNYQPKLPWSTPPVHQK